MGYRITFLVTLVAALLALGGALAHALEFSAKMRLDRDAYFTVQRLYAGWALLGVPIYIQLAGTVALIAMAWRNRTARTFAIVSAACTVLAQVDFWLFTYPANVATSNWTQAPADWEILRRTWERSHFAGAVLQFAACLALVWSALGYVSRDARLAFRRP